MADYHAPCVVTPLIPVEDIKPAERLLLNAIFEHEIEGSEVYYFAKISREMHFTLPRAEIAEAVAGSSADCVATRLLVDLLGDSDQDQDDEVEVDADDHWMDILQEIVRRSASLSHLAVETAYTCTRMRPDGFGGQAIVITADAQSCTSTSQFIDDALGRLLPI